MQNISRFVAFDDKEFKDAQLCEEYENEQMALIQREFFKMAKAVDGEYLGIPYWTEEHTVYILKPKSEHDIEIINLVSMIYSDGSVGNKYSGVWRDNGEVTIRWDGKDVVTADDLNQILIIEFGYGGGIEGCLFESDFMQVWDFGKVIERQSKAIVGALSMLH